MAIYDLTAEELANEIWTDVIGYEAVYSVSYLGRLRRDLAAPGARVGRILKQQKHPGGYRMVALSKNGETKQFLVHILVAAAFHGPCPEGKEVNHKDTQDPKTMKTNNRASNLEYVTSKQNKKHASSNGLLATGLRNGVHTHPEMIARGEKSGARKHPDKIPRGESHGSAKLTNAEVLAIRKDPRTQAVIAAEYSITQSYVSEIKLLKKWRHLS